jgi:hypothetical protein
MLYVILARKEGAIMEIIHTAIAWWERAAGRDHYAKKLKTQA